MLFGWLCSDAIYLLECLVLILETCQAQSYRYDSPICALCAELPWQAVAACMIGSCQLGMLLNAVVHEFHTALCWAFGNRQGVLLSLVHHQVYVLTKALPLEQGLACRAIGREGSHAWR